MTSFNEFKNNTQILKKYLSKMNTISECDIKPQWIEENSLKNNNPHIFLQILHYILIKFSPFILFVKVLDYYPTIKDDSDKKFVTNAIILSRKLFQIDVRIDIDQFLSSKFVQKKTQFVSCLCKAVYEFHERQNKQSSGTLVTKKSSKQQNQLSNYIPSKLPRKYQVDQDSEDQMPRNLNLAPSNTNRPVVSRQHIQDSSSDEDFKELMNKKKQLSKIKQNTTANKLPIKQKTQMKSKANQIKKGNIFSKNVQREEEQENEFYQSQRLSIQNKKTLEKYSLKNHQCVQNLSQKSANSLKQQNINQHQTYRIQQNYEGQRIEKQYVSRQQFMQIVTGMTRNFTQLLTKFNQFQLQVGGWVQNVNAKMSILEQNVKTIKNNL